VTKVIQEYNVVVIHKYPEEFLVLLVGRHVQRRSLREFGTQLVQLVRVQTRGGVLEVPPPDVHRIVYTLDSAGVVPVVLAGVIPHRLHDTRRGANDVVDVTQVIPNETFAPEILPPIREEDECWWVEYEVMCKEGGRAPSISGMMDAGESNLHLRFVRFAYLP